MSTRSVQATRPKRSFEGWLPAVNVCSRTARSFERRHRRRPRNGGTAEASRASVQTSLTELRSHVSGLHSPSGTFVVSSSMELPRLPSVRLPSTSPRLPSPNTSIEGCVTVPYDRATGNPASGNDTSLIRRNTSITVCPITTVPEATVRAGGSDRDRGRPGTDEFRPWTVRCAGTVSRRRTADQGRETRWETGDRSG